MAGDATSEQLEAGRGYEALFVPALFRPWPARVAAAAGVGPGDRVLDVACGSGVLARHLGGLVGPSGHVTGLDPAPGMIAAAQEIDDHIDWVQGRAEDLPFDDGAFDHVLCQFGLMFFDDRPGALAQMFRVLKPGGTCAVAVWNDIDRNPAYGDIVAVLDAHVSKAAGDAVRAPFCLGDPAGVEALLRDAGFADVTHETHSEEGRFPSPRTMVEAELRGWLPLFGIHLDEDRIADILEKADTRLAPYASASGEAVFPTSAYIVTGRKP